MKRILLFLVLLNVLFSCRIEEKFLPKHIHKENDFREISNVKIKTLLKDPLLNVRAIEVNKKELRGITSNGKMISMLLDDESSLVKLETLDSSNSRSCALQNDVFFHLTIESPAKLFKDGMLVYQENHPKSFYDSMEFWNDQEGIAIGDPTEDCMSIIITRDGGETWTKLTCDILPKSKEGEAAFAASDTNIAIVDDHTWVATGGKASRILYSPDKGKTWEVFNTPIIQGMETTGMYSIDFYDEFNGFAIGGDYTKPEHNKANKMLTKDGGRTWNLVAIGKEPGYRSCVQFIPNRKGKELVAVGFKGIDYSNDYGYTWKQLSEEGFYTIRFLNDSIAYAAGKGRISKLTFKK